MATIKSFTSVEQSRKLAEILSIESADCFWDYDDLQKYHRINWFEDGYEKDSQLRLNKNNVCAWSLAALRNLLPPAIKPNKDSYLFLFESHNTFDKSWVYRYYNEDDTSYLYYKNTNEVDACVAMIEKLHELNLL